MRESTTTWQRVTVCVQTAREKERERARESKWERVSESGLVFSVWSRPLSVLALVGLQQTLWILHNNSFYQIVCVGVSLWACTSAQLSRSWFKHVLICFSSLFLPRSLCVCVFTFFSKRVCVCVSPHVLLWSPALSPESSVHPLLQQRPQGLHYIRKTLLRNRSREAEALLQNTGRQPCYVTLAAPASVQHYTPLWNRGAHTRIL